MIQGQLSGHGTAVVLIAAGALVGSNLRYALGAVAGEGLLATIFVNATGCFGLGVLLFDARADDLLSQRLRYLLATGLFASFTTYSTFIADIALAQPEPAALYACASYATGFGGVILSRRVVALLSTTDITHRGGN